MKTRHLIATAALALLTITACTNSPSADAEEETTTPDVVRADVTGRLITPTVTEGDSGVPCVSDNPARDEQLTERRHIPILGPDATTVVGIGRLGPGALEVTDDQRRCVFPFTAEGVETSLGFYGVTYRHYPSNPDTSWRTEAELFADDLTLFWGYGFMD